MIGNWRQKSWTCLFHGNNLITFLINSSSGSRGGMSYFPAQRLQNNHTYYKYLIKGKSPGGQVSYLQWAVHHQEQSQPYISTFLVTLWFETIFSNPGILKSPNEQTWLFTLSCISLILLCNCSLLTFWLKNCDILAAVLKGGLSGFSRKHNFKKASMGQ